MYTLVLIIIYIVFIALGLDGVFGSAWPAIQADVGVVVGAAGIVVLVSTSMSAVSSFATTYLMRYLGIGSLLAICTGMTTFALFGISNIQTFTEILMYSALLGLSAGIIDTSLNDYVANHYSAKHMHWLHAFWGIGASLGPLIIAFSLSQMNDWRDGYLKIATIEGAVFILLIFTIPLWRLIHNRVVQNSDEKKSSHTKNSKNDLLRTSIIVFFLYIGIEASVGIWLASYVTTVQAVAIGTAAIWTSVYFAMITISRIGAGFKAVHLSSNTLIKGGVLVSLIGFLLLVSGINPVVSVIGVALVGIGFGPIFPALIFSTPERFGSEDSTRAMSLQMSSSYIGALVVPPTIGFLTSFVGMSVLSYFIPLALILLFILILRF